MLNDALGDPNGNFMHTAQHGIKWLDKEHAAAGAGNMLWENGQPHVAVTPSGEAERRGRPALGQTASGWAYVGGPEGFSGGGERSVPLWRDARVQGSVLLPATSMTNRR